MKLRKYLNPHANLGAHRSTQGPPLTPGGMANLQQARGGSSNRGGNMYVVYLVLRLQHIAVSSVAVPFTMPHNGCPIDLTLQLMWEVEPA